MVIVSEHIQTPFIQFEHQAINAGLFSCEGANDDPCVLSRTGYLTSNKPCAAQPSVRNGEIGSMARSEN